MKKGIKRLWGIFLAGALFCTDMNMVQGPASLEVLAEELPGGEQEAETVSGNEETPGGTETPPGNEETPEGTETLPGNEEAPEGTETPPESQEPSETISESPDPSEDTENDSGTKMRTPEGTDGETAEWVEAAGEELAGIAAEREIMALVYLSDEYPVRKEPSYESEAAVTVLSGQMVTILDIYVDENFEVWEYVGLEYRGQQMYGYVPRTYLACSDSRFLKWEERYGMNPGSGTYAIDESDGTYPDIQQFPESYRPALLALKEKHPDWIFAKMNTGLDWNQVVYNELQGAKSLAHKSLPDWAKEGLYDTGNWYYASEAALKLYLDPRNGLTEKGIFQFELLLYNEEYHTEQAVADFLNNTFMNDSAFAPGTEMTYARIFWSVATEETRRVSPFHLVARVLQEQGRGTSPLISGTYPGYEGYYNYFNVSASGTTNQQVIESGLRYAKEHNWNNAYQAIRGGADFISANYIRKGQDTLYLQKYNVNPDGHYAVYTHQYMQNISAAATEAANVKKLYEQSHALDNSFVFKIPVYENMPAEPCAEPKISTNVYLSLPEGYAGASVMWLDGVPYEGEIRNGSLIAEAPDGNAKTAVVYKYNENGVPVGMYVWTLEYSGTAYRVTPQPGLEDLLTYHGFSIRITGKSGLRCKTGISSELRNALTAVGVNGYTLKEYGTLIMNQANRDLYPMIKGGEKVVVSMAYGIDDSGALQDVVYETVEGRYRYTSVLVGIPVDQYKTELAFRGYAVLEKDGAEIAVYGPAVPRSIYALARQLIDMGSYESGTEAYAFLQKLIGDADALENETAPDTAGGGTEQNG